MREEHRDTARESSNDTSRRAAAPAAGDPHHLEILSLQRAAGNRAVSGLIRQRSGGGGDPVLARDARAPSGQWWMKYWYAPEAHALANAEAKSLIGSARAVEKRITADVGMLAVRFKGRTEGLKNRFKGEDSLTRKLEDRAATTVRSDKISPANAIKKEGAGISDALRYTIVVPSTEYTRIASELRTIMTQELGYEPGKFENYWKKATYKGINSTWRTKATPTQPSVAFEVQLHTEESIAIKELNHADYETARAKDVDPAVKTAANARMAKNWEGIVMPPGILDVQSYGK